jgi:hypothetical protein
MRAKNADANTRRVTPPRGALFAVVAFLVSETSSAWSGYNNVTILEITMYQAPADVGALVKFAPATPNL